MFTDLWFRTFLDTIDDAQTLREVSFLERTLPLPDFRRVLDLCCGHGRHALPLAQRGYRVTGIDREPALIARARAAHQEHATFIETDVREVGALAGTWDAVIIMWASFGYFSPEQNKQLLRDMHGRLRPGGRAVLDIYNHEFFARHQGQQLRARAGLEISEEKRIEDDRLYVELRYGGHDEIDRFSWQVFRPAEIIQTVTEAGFAALLLCTGFDDAATVTREHPRMQLVMQCAP